MEYRILKYFLTVAREENITRAAEILHISQPALSRQLMQLEEELGAQLFIREKRRVTLTDAGLFLRRRAREITELTEKTENEFKENINTTEGTVSIGSGEAESMRTIALIMQKFSEIYPNVKFELYSNNASHIKERLDRGLLDIGVLLAPSDLEKYDYIPLNDKERWGVIMTRSCPLSEKKGISAEDLIGYRVLASKRDAEQGVTHWFGKLYDKLDIYATYNLLYNAAMIVECGMAVAFTIEGAFSLYKNPEIVFRPFYPELSVSSALIWKKYQPLSPAVAKFIEFLKCNPVMNNYKK